ncbi:hypothetical protein [Seonamhaeicola sp.]|uniref:hypothetical protein n=1 Tax=Seonamhaeicola sp. TaxID=1912245 RepID=UPI00261180FD|nr:hypothetical protein [Seonamhaeicola sp.]
MYNRYIFIVVALLSIIYGGYGLYVIGLDHPSPTIIQAEGLLLDSSKTYHFSNYKSLDAITDSNPDDIILNYTDSNLYPNTLGKLYYLNGRWSFAAHKSVRNPLVNDSNPFLPFIRQINKTDGEFTFYRGESDVSEENLFQGIVVNFPAGKKAHRKTIKLKRSNGKIVVLWKDDGLGVKYMLSRGRDTLGVNFNMSPNQYGKYNYNYDFDNTTSHNGKYKLIIESSQWRNSYKVYNDNNVKVLQGSRVFELGNILFTIDQRFSNWKKILFISHYILLILSILFYFFALFRNQREVTISKEIFGVNIEILREIVNPIHESLIWLRFLITLLALLGIPILITAFNYNTNGGFYSIIVVVVIHILPLTLVLMPISKSVIKTILAKKRIKATDLKIKPLVKLLKNSKIIVVFLFAALVVFKYGSYNERVLGMPSLHLQKIAIVISFFLFNSSAFDMLYSRIDKVLFKLRRKVYIPMTQNLFVIFYSLLLTIASSDFGSCLFVFISILLIELILNESKIKKAFTTLFVGLVSIFLLINVFGLSQRKFYRIYYTYFPPDNKFYNGFHQGDKESIAYIYTNLKNLIENLTGFWNDLKIPRLAQSVADTDYAFHWSLMLGGLFFIGLFLLILFFILSHLFFVLKVTTTKVRITETETYDIANTSQYGRVVSFLTAITLVQFVYQIFTNLMLPGAILTGQPLTFISVGVYDAIFLAILFLLLDSIFYNKSIGQEFRVKEAKRSTPTLRQFKYKSIALSQVFFLFIMLMIVIKSIMIVRFQKDVIIMERRFQKTNDFDNNAIPSQSDYGSRLRYNQAIIEKASEICVNGLLDIENQQKSIVRNLQSLYYAKRRIKEYYPKVFKLEAENLKKRLSYSRFFEFGSTLISDQNGPFGEVLLKKIFSNGAAQLYADNIYYSNIDWASSAVNVDLNAELNRVLEGHIEQRLSRYNIEGSIIILDNLNKREIVNANYPFFEETPMAFKSYFVGSVKKPLLLYALLECNQGNGAFTCLNSRGEVSGINYWMRWSDNNMSAGVLKYLTENEQYEFSQVLLNDFNLPFYSPSTSKYSDMSFDELMRINNLSTYRSIAIGGVEPYQPIQVAKWFSHIAVDAFSSNEPLKEALNSPLTGTATSTKRALENQGLNPIDFIAKTGTFEKDGVNISSSFLISNNRYTTLIVLNGEQPSNLSHRTAKYLFNDSVLPLLIEYGVL